MNNTAVEQWNFLEVTASDLLGYAQMSDGHDRFFVDEEALVDLVQDGSDGEYERWSEDWIVTDADLCRALSVLAEAQRDGWADFTPGVEVCTASEMIRRQADWEDEDPGKELDFSGSDFWFHTDNGVVEAIETVGPILKYLRK